MVAPAPEKRSTAATWGAVALLAVSVAVIFAQSVRGDFLLWDDDVNITGNPHLRGLSWESVQWMFTDTTYMRRYVPFAWLGWMIEQRFFGLTAVSAHAGNVLFHAINAVLVFFLVRRLVPRRENNAGKFIDQVALAAAWLWALHPLRVEVVAWASGRMYAQGACFALLGVLAYLRAAELAPGDRRRWGWLGLALAALAIAILTYPVFVPVVAVLPLIDLFALRRFEPGMPLWRGARNRAVWLEKIPFLALAGGIALVTIAARAKAQGIWAPPPTLAEFGLGERIAQAGYVWAYYVWKPLVPFGLAPVYTTLVDFDPRGAVFVFSVAGVVLVSAGLFWQRARWPGAWALWLAHLILIAPMLGLAEHPHYTNDRYSYLQGVLGVIGMAWLVRAGGRMALYVFMPVVILLSVVSGAQVAIWHDSETLFRRLYDHVGPTEYRADIAFRLGDVLRISGRFADAAHYYEESLKILPHVARAAVPHTGLGLIALERGELQAAANRFQAALRLDPRFAPSHAGLGRVLVAAGQWPEAVKVLRQAVALQPDDVASHEILGVALVRGGRPAEAIAAFEAVARLRPRHLESVCNLISALAAGGRAAEAVKLGREVVRLAPASPRAQLVLGEALRAAGPMEEAITVLREAVRLQPDGFTANLWLGLSLGAAGRAVEAEPMLRAALKIDPASADAHYNLGLVLRDLRRRDEAIAELTRVLELNPSHAPAREALAVLRAP